MAAIIVIGLIAWALSGAVEDTVRGIRGDKPAGPRKGFRGYLDDRWQALADRHHQNKALLDNSASPDWWTRKRLEGRRKALALGGMRTDEDIERAAYQHRRRIGLIRQGIDPDTVPPPPGSPTLKRRRQLMPDRDAHGKFKPTDDQKEAPTEEQKTTPPQPKPELDTTDVPGLTDLATTDNKPTDPQATPWTPFNDPKENTNMTTAGEINNPHDVKQFADAMSASLNATTSTVDTLNSVTAGLANRVADHAANAFTAENAAAGMDRLSMSDAAAAARALIEQQQQIQTALQTIVDTLANNAATIADAIEAARPNVDALARAYQAQLSVADTRAGAGLGNLSKDQFLDGDV
jgi:hypothetical protein